MNPITPRLASRVLHRAIAAKPTSPAHLTIAAGGYGRLGGYGRAAGGYGIRAFTQATQLRKEVQHPSPEFNPQSSGESKLYSFEDVCLPFALALSKPSSRPGQTGTNTST